MWELRLNGSPVAMVLDAEGNVFVTGYSPISTIGGNYYTAKYAAANGGLLWEQRYTGTTASLFQPSALVLDANGNAVVTGSSSGNHWDFYTAKYTAGDGALLWEHRYNGTNHSGGRATAVAVDSYGNVIVTGNITQVGNGYPDFYTAKYAATNGALMWEQRYDGPAKLYDEAIAVLVDREDNAIVVGSTFGTNSGSDFYVVKYAGLNGATLWATHDERPGYATPRDAVLDEIGNIVVTGEINDDTNFYYAATYAGINGTVVWRRSSEKGGTAIETDGDGGVIIAGTAYSNDSGDSDYYLGRLAIESGAVIWERRIDGPNGGDDWIDRPQQLAVSGDGYIALSGYSDYGPGSEYDFVTMLFRNPLGPISIQAAPLKLRFHGRSNHRYSIERAPAVTGPWTTVATNLVPIADVISWSDTNAPASSAFYRVATP